MTQKIELEVNAILTEYTRDVEKEVQKAANGVATATVNKLRKHSPTGKSRKHYKNGWKKKKSDKLGVVVYNEAKPGLTHLLNDGHIIRNANGEYGRKAGDKHIDTQAEWAEAEFVKRVEKSI